MATYRRGDIVFARVPDPTGARIDHDHPVILWTPTAKIVRGAIIDTVVISHRVTKPYPKGHIPLPWHPDGHPITGLYYESVAKCDWTVPLTLDDLRGSLGVTPPSIMDLIYVALVDRLKETRAAESSKHKRN